MEATKPCHLHFASAGVQQSRPSYKHRVS
ncbi:unnamed protein product [Medioppia subpectinata]|uniref:Uncharacterized protein n=1 Tax=Medioppia subpectinata TaxID=1979941 RepID=A0A7R9LVW4_9ACAR|nr:unnamed protein product [Medioppia subpectinata]CAG2122193.1 unnamed protein product [Medioppia subpectinata]